MKLRKPSASAAWTSRYRASSRRMTARTAAARPESPGPGGRCGVSRMCRSSFDTIPAIACSAAMAACSSGCCSGVAMSWSSETAPLRWQPAARTYNRKTRRRMIGRIDAFAPGSARAMQALEVRFLDEKVECEDRSLGESRGDQSREGLEDQRESIRRQVADGVHRARNETVRSGPNRTDRPFRIEEVVPVVGVTAQGARGPEFGREPDHDKHCPNDDRDGGRNGEVPRSTRRDVEYDQRERVVVHDDRRRPPEPAERFGAGGLLRGNPVPLLAPQGRSHKHHVRHSTENGVREYQDLRRRHVRPNSRTVAAPRSGRCLLRYQKSTRRNIRTGPGRSIVRLQEP